MRRLPCVDRVGHRTGGLFVGEDLEELGVLAILRTRRGASEVVDGLVSSRPDRSRIQHAKFEAWSLEVFVGSGSRILRGFERKRRTGARLFGATSVTKRSSLVPALAVTSQHPSVGNR